MPEFFNVLGPEETFLQLLKQLPIRVQKECIPTFDALGRVTVEEARSPEDLPAFPRSSMDGFSVWSGDTFGSSEGIPAYLEVAGEVPMGQLPQTNLAIGQAARAYTGGMLANGADAVVMVENTQTVDENTIEVVRPVAPGENVIQVGEDLFKGDLVLPKGHIVRPQDIGGLLALGITKINVACRPMVSIVSTGDELVCPDISPGPAEIRDINTHTVSALVRQCGGIPLPVALVKDDFEAQREAALKGLECGDILLFSAGSSVSNRDLTADVISSLQNSRVLTHGISLKPGKPTIVGVANGKPVFGLPGNPVSAMVVFDLIVRPTIYFLSGCSQLPLYTTIKAKLLRDVASVTGREDYVQVRLEAQDGEICAEPVFGKSNLIHTLVRSDGVLKIPMDKGGLYSGEEVTVRMY